MCPYSRRLLDHVTIVNDYADTRFFREYLRENEIFQKTLFACSYGPYGAPVEFLDSENYRKYRDIVPLRLLKLSK